MKYQQQFKLYKTSLITNSQAIFDILSPYRHHSIVGQKIPLRQDDFIQLLSRVKLQASKLREFFNLIEDLQQQEDDQQTNNKKGPLVQLARRVDLSVSHIQSAFALELANGKQAISEVLMELRTQVSQSVQDTENEIMSDINKLGKLFQSGNDEQNSDLSRLCSDAYRDLLMDECKVRSTHFALLSPIRYIDPQLTPASGTVNKSFGNQSMNIQTVRCMNDGEWDSKLDSNRDQSKLDIDRIREALKVLEQANVLIPENLQMLYNLSSTNENTGDRYMFLEMFLQVVRLKKKNKQVEDKDQSNILLREQVLQVPQSQEFSFESPLPSLREEQRNQNKKVPQQLRHVELEDLLCIQTVDDQLITEPDADKDVIKPQESPIRTYIPKTIKHTEESSSFYSQRNIHRNLPKKNQQISSQAHPLIQAVRNHDQYHNRKKEKSVIRSRKASFSQHTLQESQLKSQRANSVQTTPDFLARSLSSPNVPQDF